MSRIGKNIGALYFIQIANYVLPLLSIPYLIRTIGIANFGLLAFSAALVQYFVVLTDYGFSLSASRKASVLRDDFDALSAHVSSVYLIKFAFMFISALLLAIVVFFVKDYWENWPVYFATFILVIGNVLYPGWLYQGLERMTTITVMNVTAKAISVAAIFIFISGPEDVLLAAIFQSAGTLIAGIIGILAMRKLCPEVRFIWPGMSGIIDSLHDGWHIFVSQLSAILINGSNIFLLGVLQGPSAVGQYAVAEKIIKAANNGQVPVCNAIYPRVSHLFAKSPDDAIALLRKATKIMLPLMLLGSSIIFVFADYIVLLVTGSDDPEIALMLKILAIIPTSVFLDNIFGTQILLNIGKKSKFLNAVLVSGVFSIATALLIVPKLGPVGSAITYLSAQLIMLLLVMIYANRAGINLQLKSQ